MSDDVRRWVLYIDESGKFQNEEAAVLVGGMLKELEPGRERVLYDAYLKAKIRRAIPEVAWPPHTAHLNHGTCWLLWGDLHHGQRFDIKWGELWIELRGKLSPKQHDELDAAIRSSREVDYEIIEALTAQADQKQKSELIHFANTRRAEWKQAMRGAGDFAVFAVDHPRGERAAGDPKLDRYSLVLVTLLERVRDGLLAMGGRHSVELLVGERDVTHYTDGERSPLDGPHGHHLLSRISSHPRDADLTWSHFRVIDYKQSSTPAGMVVADNLVNAMCKEINKKSTTLEDIERKVAGIYGLATLLPTSEALAWSSACGEASRALDEVRAVAGGVATAPRFEGAPRWIPEQYDMWTAHLRAR